MAPVGGRNEVPDSEDEPMTSSPVAVSDGTADKLFAMAHVPPQDTQDAPQEATRLHQATSGTVANVAAQRTDGLDADQSIASIDIDAPMDEQTDIQPTTTVAPSNQTDEVSNNVANDIHRDIAPHLGSETDDMRPSQHATMVDYARDNQHIHVSDLTAGAETVTAPAAQQTSEIAGDAVRPEVTTPKQQPETVDNKVALECTSEHSSCRSSYVSENINEPEGEPAPQQVEADLAQHISFADDQVSAVRSNKQGASQEDPSTLVTFQHDTPLLPVPPPSSDYISSNESMDSGHVSETTRPTEQDAIQRLKDQLSNSGSDAKHGVVSKDVHDNINDEAAGLRTEPEGQNKGLDLENEIQQNVSMSLSSSSGVDVESHGDMITSKDNSNEDDAYRSLTSTNAEPQKSGTGSVSYGPDSKATSFDTSMDIDIPPSARKVETQTSNKEAAASSSLSTAESTNVPTAHSSAEQTSQDPSQARLEMSDIPASTNVRETKKAVPEEHPTTSESTSNLQMIAHPQPPGACPTPTPAKTPQEITLAELKAQKSAMLASLAALPAIQVLMEENASADVEMADGDDEPTEVDIMAAANKIVKDHIKLLHEYNELKDVGQGLMGLIADQRGVRIIEVQEEFGIEAQD
ncbi:hypothetical protein HBI26_133010 [Parastagonospora nodorum]|nr:hypothetical protein HBH74_025640 [Parastagonospora nodorum]KAH4960473.1 hypothetical protein HBH73_078080 [Parastagonospora nodorum]KAH5415948.1 hypothetical protein HBI46_127600 [Parastagonospora nodorum]KAH5577963.1 hypothetical protein HBI26_133010 [Parastagonospora nodorum]